ncbi:MAG: hypothetical protein KBC98_00340 [Candidatus Pacebacteria bacterium]|nr:hypothetical protein [Candidatus Paceibacterota bacterium]
MKKELALKLYFFGSSKAGFNLYPFPPFELFKSYYTSTAPEEWVLSLFKKDGVVYHIYVRYGLMTSLLNGRGGGFLGISFSTKDYFFQDTEFLRKEIFEIIFEKLLEEKKIIKTEGTETGIVPYQFYDEMGYIEEWRQRIEKDCHSTKEVKNKLIKITDDLSDYNGTCYNLNINSNPYVVSQYFKSCGYIRLSDHEKYEKV